MMPETRQSFTGTVGPANSNHYITYATLDPTKQRPYVCVSVPASAPDVSAAIYDDKNVGSFAMDYAATDTLPIDYNAANGVSMKIS